MVAGSVMGGAAGWLAQAHGWTYAYLVVGLPNLALGVLLCVTLKDPPREGGAPDGSAGSPVRMGEALRVLGTPGIFYAMMACVGVQGAVSWVIIGWMPTQMMEQFKLGQGAAGFSALGFLYVSQIIGLLAGGRWTDAASRTNPRARIFLPALAVLCAAPAFWLTGWIHLIGLTILSLSLWGLAMGFLARERVQGLIMAVAA
jgi:sugar phosphate permease